MLGFRHVGRCTALPRGHAQPWAAWIPAFAGITTLGGIPTSQITPAQSKPQAEGIPAFAAMTPPACIRIFPATPAQEVRPR